MKSMEAPRNTCSGVSYVPRLEVPGVFHLVELRVRSGQIELEEFHNRLLAVAALHGSIFRCGIQLWGYNILSNRVLLVVVPLRPHAIGPALMNADYRFARRFKEAQRRALPFWERGYLACPFADEVAWRVLRYVDMASVPEGGDVLDSHALSSAAEHAGLLKYGLLTAPPERLPSPMAWRAFLFSHEDEQFGQALEFCLRTGKPFGPSSFIHRIEEACGRRVRPSYPNPSRLFDASGPVPNPGRAQPRYATASSPAMQCRSAV
jgi:hypothetical protein